MAKVYGFTNENLSSYKDLYSFDNARVLSVLGSGDQYFSSLLYGAKDVVLYDCNKDTLDPFLVKFEAFKKLTYEEFYRLFVESHLQDENLLGRLNIPKNRSISNNLLYSPLSDFPANYQNDRIIPYFNEEQYYKLQSILQHINVPTIYFQGIEQLKHTFSADSFDIMLVSNIFTWLSMSVAEFRVLLDSFPAKDIQAFYAWNPDFYLKEEFLENGFCINEVPGVSLVKNKKDLVVSLHK